MNQLKTVLKILETLGIQPPRDLSSRSDWAKSLETFSPSTIRDKNKKLKQGVSSKKNSATSKKKSEASENVQTLIANLRKLK